MGTLLSTSTPTEPLPSAPGSLTATPQSLPPLALLSATAPADPPMTGALGEQQHQCNGTTTTRSSLPGTRANAQACRPTSRYAHSTFGEPGGAEIDGAGAAATATRTATTRPTAPHSTSRLGHQHLRPQYGRANASRATTATHYRHAWR